jgi:hypothetical protein
VKLAGYTGMKTSQYTEGALLSAEKPGASRAREATKPAHELPVANPEPVATAKTGGS